MNGERKRGVPLAMSTLDLERLERLCAEATPLPWEPGFRGANASYFNAGAKCLGKCDGARHAANSMLIPEAVNSIPALLALVRTLRAETIEECASIVEQTSTKWHPGYGGEDGAAMLREAAKDIRALAARPDRGQETKTT